MPGLKFNKREQALVNAIKSDRGDYQQIKNQAMGFVFLGTPHKGTSLTIAGKLLSLLGYWKGSSTSLLDLLEPDSRENEELHDDFMSFLRGQDRLKRTLCVFEAVKESIFGVPLMHVRSHQHWMAKIFQYLILTRFLGG